MNTLEYALSKDQAELNEMIINYRKIAAESDTLYGFMDTMFADMDEETRLKISIYAVIAAMDFGDE